MTLKQLLQKEIGKLMDKECPNGLMARVFPLETNKVICEDCQQEMLNCDGCTKSELTFPDGTTLKRLTKHYNESTGRCHDCNAKHGQFHHLGCDVETCPKCNQQLLMCGCLTNEEEE